LSAGGKAERVCDTCVVEVDTQGGGNTASAPEGTAKLVAGSVKFLKNMSQKMVR